MGQQGWKVYSTQSAPTSAKQRTTRERREIDIVFYDEGMSAEEVRRSLIDHDGYPSDITVRKG